MENTNAQAGADVAGNGTEPKPEPKPVKVPDVERSFTFTVMCQPDWEPLTQSTSFSTSGRAKAGTKTDETREYNARVQFSDLRELADCALRYANTNLTRLAGNGHWPYSEAPDAGPLVNFQGRSVSKPLSLLEQVQRIDRTTAEGKAQFKEIQRLLMEMAALEELNSADDSADEPDEFSEQPDTSKPAQAHVSSTPPAPKTHPQHLNRPRR